MSRCKTYKWRKENKICVDCGQNEPVEGISHNGKPFVRCDYCLEKNAEDKQRRIDEYRGKGLCPCGKERDGNWKSCPNCKKKYYTDKAKLPWHRTHTVYTYHRRVDAIVSEIEKLASYIGKHFPGESAVASIQAMAENVKILKRLL